MQKVVVWDIFFHSVWFWAKRKEGLCGVVKLGLGLKVFFLVLYALLVLCLWYEVWMWRLTEDHEVINFRYMYSNTPKACLTKHNKIKINAEGNESTKVATLVKADLFMSKASWEREEMEFNTYNIILTHGSACRECVKECNQDLVYSMEP